MKTKKVSKNRVSSLKDGLHKPVCNLAKYCIIDDILSEVIDMITNSHAGAGLVVSTMTRQTPFSTKYSYQLKISDYSENCISSL